MSPMKDVLGVVTSVMGALYFLVFLITLKPDAVSAVPHMVRTEVSQWRMPWIGR
jgi:hypothetical protein